MAFVNASLLFGVVMVGIPIVLHLAMRRKPKLIEFPALQFVRQRRESNQRQLQLKHLLLLLLRVLAILCLAFALARPSVDRNSLGNWLVVGLLSFVVLMTGLSALAVYVYQRGKGLMIGIALSEACTELVELALKEKILINTCLTYRLTWAS